MGGNISLFSGYNQSENRTTNYCLLVMKMLYEDNPKYLSELLAAIIDEDCGEMVGVTFRQQEKKTRSVPDGLISQRAFTVYIETKNYDWFSDSQLAAHLDALASEDPGMKILLALGNFEHSEGRFAGIRELCAEKHEGQIVFEAVTFEEFLIACEQLTGLSKNLSDMIAEFREYLQAQGLLSSWRRLLDVVNCARHAQDVIDDRRYLCPAAGGAYSHARCQYFGLYRNKVVDKIAVIEALVDLEDAKSAKVIWSNVKRAREAFIKLAREKHALRGGVKYPARVFILGPLKDTSFRKTSKGGMWGAKKYFDIGALEPEDADDLAQKLNGKEWPEKEWVVK